MRITDMEVIPVSHRKPPLRNSWGTQTELAARSFVRPIADVETEVGRGDWLPNEPRWCR